jgi:enterochelin esterase-like enzyme
VTIYNTYKKAPKLPLKIYMSYGTGKDTEQQDLPMVNILKSQNYEFKLDVVTGGTHSWTTWKTQLETIAKYFFANKED